MRKKVLWALLALVVLLLVWAACVFAMPLALKTPHTVICDKTTQTGVATTFIYWMPTGGTWSDTNRVAITGDLGATAGYDLTKSITVNGTYSVGATYADANGDESAMSNVIPFVLSVPGSPTGAALK